MLALIWRALVAAALRRSWAQRSRGWLAVMVALVLLGRLDARARRRLRPRS
ncbi:MAG: hypothetical protein HIU57_06170 [Acidobacteria bacterium]|nr:hypothetical protein [Acidobacteriota bacterium]